MAWVTLHRPPPDTFTFDNSFPVFSTRVTFNPGQRRAAFTAQKNPAAPPPMTMREGWVVWVVMVVMVVMVVLVVLVVLVNKLMS